MGAYAGVKGAEDGAAEQPEGVEYPKETEEAEECIGVADIEYGEADMLEGYTEDIGVDVGAKADPPVFAFNFSRALLDSS